MQNNVLSVTAVTRYIARLLGQAGPLQTVQVRGELSNYKRHTSGHHYFTLKDETCQLRAALFRQEARHLNFTPTDGIGVVAQGRIAVYERQGQYQLYVTHLRYDGTGALFAAFEALRRQLEQEGLFDPSRKRPLPRFPACVGLVTSPTGAAIQDLTTILRRRWPGVEMILSPALVQGAEAADSLVQALQAINQHPRVQVILLGRGGGSLEDLAPFNEEKVARAIFSSPRPVISAVGHETDVTIADKVADARAPTPSGAAEMAVPDREEMTQYAAALTARLDQAAQRSWEVAQQRLQALETRRVWRYPQEPWASRWQSLDDLHERLQTAEKNLQFRRREQLAGLEQTLEALNPLQVLQRGYSVLLRYPQGEILHRRQQLQVGEQAEVRFHDGRAICRIEKILSWG